MMGYENQGFEEAYLYASKKEMESLILDDDPNGSSSGRKPFPDPLSASSLPFAKISTDDDVLHPCTSQSQNPNSFNSILEPPYEYLQITVSDPQKEQELTNSLVLGGSIYGTYLITTRPNLPQFSGTEFSTRRRFRDVVTLSDRLSEAYRGFFIPVRPDKSVVES